MGNLPVTSWPGFAFAPGLPHGKGQSPLVIIDDVPAGLSGVFPPEYDAAASNGALQNPHRSHRVGDFMSFSFWIPTPRSHPSLASSSPCALAQLCACGNCGSTAVSCESPHPPQCPAVAAAAAAAAAARGPGASMFEVMVESSPPSGAAMTTATWTSPTAAKWEPGVPHLPLPPADPSASSTIARGARESKSGGALFAPPDHVSCHQCGATFVHEHHLESHMVSAGGSRLCGPDGKHGDSERTAETARLCATFLAAREPSLRGAISVGTCMLASAPELVVRT
jgi:hypothetical protein